MNRIDEAVLGFDRALRTVFGQVNTTGRDHPAGGVSDIELSDSERDLSERLLRIDHVGEVCAQALYQGQALTARDPQVRDALQEAADEENDHLEWCSSRLRELDGRVSLLNPIWYAGSFAIGATTGLLGDRWSLGFLAETEKQVGDHLQSHLDRLPEADHRSRAILQQMQTDELKHATTALEQGGTDLPEPAKKAMKVASSVMTRTAWWV